MRRTCILGIDVGGTKTAVVLGDDTGRIHDRTEFATAPQRGLEAALHDICTHAEQLRQRAVQQSRAPQVASVSIGGPLDIERGIVLSPPNLPGWDRVPLRSILEERLGLRCFVEHDGNAGALAEWYFGAARGARNVVFLTMGTGFGAGLILDGRLYRGSCDMAGEVGHVRLSDEGPAAYGKAGSWEAFCSGTGIVRLAALRFPGRWVEGRNSVQELADLARSGDRDARAVFAEVGKYLGRGLALLVDVLNPEVIVIGALAVRLGELVLRPARDEMRREALERATAAVQVVPAALGESIGDVGALCAAIAAMGGPPAQ